MGDQNIDLKATWNTVYPVISQLLTKIITESPPEIQDLVKSTSEATRVSDEDCNLARLYLTDALEDLRSCRVLHSKKIESRSVFFLQQATEKTAKAWALGFGMLDRAQVRSSRHKTPMIFLKILERKAVSRWIPLIKQLDPLMHTDISKALRVFRKRRHPDVAKMTKTRIESYLLSVSSLDEIAVAVDLVMENFKTTFAGILGQKVLPFSIGQYMNVGMSLLILGLITFSHETFTRYSDGDVHATEPELIPQDYNSKLGIVKSIPKIDKCLTAKIKLLQDLLDKKKPDSNLDCSKV